MKNCIIVCSVLSGVCSLSSATPEFTKTNVTASIDRVLGTDDYTVNLTQTADGAAFVTIDVDNPNDRIINLVIHENASMDPEDQQSITVNIDGGGFAQVSDLKALVNVIPHSNVELILKNVNIIGDFGQSDLADSGYMEFDEVKSIVIRGNWYADVIVDDRFDSVGFTIDRVNFSGNVLDGGLEYYNGDMPFFNQQNTTPGLGDMLGSVAEPIYIRATGGFEQLSARDVIEVDFGGLTAGVHPETNWLNFSESFKSSTAMTLHSLGGEANFFNHAGGLKVGEDYGVNLTIVEALPTSTPGASSAPTYTIGKSMLAGSELNLPYKGLTTQIVINKSNGLGEWLGTVNVGPSITLGPILDSSAYTSYYTELSYELGGGAVGLAPFNFHQRESAPGAGETRDCDPYQTEVVILAINTETNKPKTLPTASIVHYGRVFMDDATDIEDLYRVEFKPDIFSGSAGWQDKSDEFQVRIGAQNNSSAWAGDSETRARRLVVIEGDPDNNGTAFAASGIWRIRPEIGKVVCADVAGNPDVEYVSSVVSGDLGSSSGTQYSWYQFRVYFAAPGGAGPPLLSTGGGPQASDLAAWLTMPFETNADGETDSQDFIDMAGQYTGN